VTSRYLCSKALRGHDAALRGNKPNGVLTAEFCREFHEQASANGTRCSVTGAKRIRLAAEEIQLWIDDLN
jgi:hypothetical protein